MAANREQATAAATLHMAREADGLILIIRWPRQTRNIVYVNKGAQRGLWAID